MVDTPDPYQILLDSTANNVAGLERQSRLILPQVQSFRTQGLGFNVPSISPGPTVDAAMADYTPEAINAGVTDIEPINDFIDACLAEALAGIKRYTKSILQTLEDGIQLINSILALPENLLMTLLQRIWRLVNSIQNLIAASDLQITCITSKAGGAAYAAQVQDLQDRMDAVIDDLYLAPDGSFDQDRLMTGFNSDLASNLNRYKTKSDELQVEIQNNVTDTIELPTTLNPASRY